MQVLLVERALYSTKDSELNLRTIPEITNAIKAGGACMACHHAPGGLQDLLNEAWGTSDESRPQLIQLPILNATSAKPAAEVEPHLSAYQFSKEIEKTVTGTFRPALAKDGGNVEILDIKGMLVYCRLTGAMPGLRQRRPDFANAGRTDP